MPANKIARVKQVAQGCDVEPAVAFDSAVLFEQDLNLEYHLQQVVVDTKSNDENQDIQHEVCPRSPNLEDEVPSEHLSGHKTLRDQVKENKAVLHSLEFVQPIFDLAFVFIYVLQINLQGLESKNDNMQ